MDIFTTLVSVLLFWQPLTNSAMAVYPLNPYILDETFAKRLFLSPALLRIGKCSFIGHKLRFAASLKNKNCYFASGLSISKTLNTYENLRPPRANLDYQE